MLIIISNFLPSISNMKGYYRIKSTTISSQQLLTIYASEHTANVRLFCNSLPALLWNYKWIYFLSRQPSVPSLFSHSELTLKQQKLCKSGESLDLSV